MSGSAATSVKKRSLLGVVSDFMDKILSIDLPTLFFLISFILLFLFISSLIAAAILAPINKVTLLKSFVFIYSKVVFPFLVAYWPCICFILLIPTAMAILNTFFSTKYINNIYKPAIFVWSFFLTAFFMVAPEIISSFTIAKALIAIQLFGFLPIFPFVLFATSLFTFSLIGWMATDYDDEGRNKITLSSTNEMSAEELLEKNKSLQGKNTKLEEENYKLKIEIATLKGQSTTQFPVKIK